MCIRAAVSNLFCTRDQLHDNVYAEVKVETVIFQNKIQKYE